MATRRENGMGSMLRRTQRNENSSPYKRRAPARHSPPPTKIPSSSSLSSFLSLLAMPFRRKPSPSTPSPPVADKSDTSDDDASDDDNGEEERRGSSPPAPELGFGPPRNVARQTVDARDPSAAATLSRMGHSLQQIIPQPKIPSVSAFLPSSANHSANPAPSTAMEKSSSLPHIAPSSRPRRSVQPAFATMSRTTGKRTSRPSFPGGIGSYGGFVSTAEPSPPPFPTSAPLESSFAANRYANTNPNPLSFASNNFSASAPTEGAFGHRATTLKHSLSSTPQALQSKTSSEVLAEFFASKGKAPLTAEERKKVAQLIAASDAEAAAESPDADPYNGVPSFSFLKASFPAPERNSISPSSSFHAGDLAPSNSNSFSFNLSTSSAGSTSQSSASAPNLSGVAIAPRRRRPINYGGGSSKRSAAITRAGFTLREHQKLVEKQKVQQATENIAPDSSAVGEKRGVRDAEEDGGGKRRRMNDGQSEEQPKEPSGVARVMNLSAQPSAPSPLRQMSKLNSPSPPRVVRRAQAPSPSSPLPQTLKDLAKPAAAPAAKPKPRPSSIVANVMRDMLAEDKQREKEHEKEKSTDKGRDEIFANPYEDAVPVPVVAAPKVRKPRRESARPAARSSAAKQSQPPSKPLSLIEKIEKTDVRPNGKKAKTASESPIPTPAPITIQPPALTFTAPSPSPKDTKPKARRPNPIVEEPAESEDTSEIEVIDLDEEEELEHTKGKSSRPSLTIDMKGGEKEKNGERGPLLGVPRQRPSFSLHSPARPSPLREMSVPIEDEVDDIQICPTVPICVYESNGLGSTSGFGSTNGFGSMNGFGSSSGFGSNTGFGGFGSSTTNGASSGTATLQSFGFTAPPAASTNSGAFSAPLPPSAPSLAPAQLPTPLKEVLKHESPLFTPKAEEPKSDPIQVDAPTSTLRTDATAFVPKTDMPAAQPGSKHSKFLAQTAPISTLPAFTFAAPVIISRAKVPQSAEARAAAELPVSKLPTFSFGSSFTPALATSATSFDWAAAGMAPPSAAGKWKCGVCDLMNEASATTKCSICESPKPASSTAPASAPAPILAPTASFDWAAAGMKPPSTGSGAQWKCGTCDCLNPSSATAKCTVCETPKPAIAGSAPSPAPAPVTSATPFNWAAAGMKVPTAASSAAWTCGTCGLSNKNCGATKCEICETPR